MPSNVGAETGNQAGNRSCLQNEIICTGSNTIQKDRQAQTLVAVLSIPGINHGAFRTIQVKFALHRREHQNRSCYVHSTKLPNHLETISSPRMGTALRSEGNNTPISLKGKGF